jgi:basic amino acid/polyamine antiporter, APA family
LTTAIKLLPIIAIVGAGLFWGDQATTGVTLSAAATGSLGAAILSTLWAYDGWMQVACVAGEMKNPGRDLPRAIIAGLLVVVAAYLAVNFALLKVLGAEKLVEFGPDAARIASEAMFGSMGGLLISSGIVISIFGCLNGHVFSNPRVPYAMAVRKELPFSQWLGAVHPRFQTPINATLFQAAIAVGMMMLASNIDQITDLAIFSIYIFFTAAFAGVIVLRRRAGAKRDKLSYHVPLYPIVPLIAIAGSLFMLVSSILDKPILLGYFFVMAISGLPFRLAIMKRRRGVREL